MRWCVCVCGGVSVFDVISRGDQSPLRRLQAPVQPAPPPASSIHDIHTLSRGNEFCQHTAFLPFYLSLALFPRAPPFPSLSLHLVSLFN